MDLTITVRGCDVCKRNDRPATRYTLTPESGDPATRDLCAEDAAPLEVLFGPLVPAEKPSPEDDLRMQLTTLMSQHEEDTQQRRARAEAAWRQQNPTPAEEPLVEEAPAQEAPAEEAPARAGTARKAAARKTAAKKTTSARKATEKKAAPARRTGTKSLTVAEIQALKAEGKL
ncbi:hypothetical protein [Streptomyces sp. NPDC091278]|uniref:hypothetical protein n=1 Tax=Streptomyces sp. NPDC091278 TaxID=3155301 RepID=UPI0034500114